MQSILDDKDQQAPEEYNVNNHPSHISLRIHRMPLISLNIGADALIIIDSVFGDGLEHLRVVDDG